MTHDDFLSGEADLEDRLHDYVDRLLGDDFCVAMHDLWTSDSGWTGEEVIAKGLATKGQWYLWVLSTFHEQVLNGGLSQFIANWDGLMIEASKGMQATGLLQFKASLDQFADTVTMFETTFEPRFKHALRAHRQFYNELRQAFQRDPRVQAFQEAFYDIHSQPGNTGSSKQMALGLIRYIETHPEEFIQTA